MGSSPGPAFRRFFPSLPTTHPQEEHGQTRSGLGHLLQLGNVSSRLNTNTPECATTSVHLHHELSSCVTMVLALMAYFTTTLVR